MTGATVFVLGWLFIALLVVFALRGAARSPETLADSVRAVLIVGMDVTSPGREYSLCPRKAGNFVLYRFDVKGTIQEEFFFDDIDLAVGTYLSRVLKGVGDDSPNSPCSR